MPEVTDPRIKAKVLAAAQPANPMQGPTVFPDGTVSFPMAVDRQLGNQQTSTSITSSEVSTSNAIKDQRAEDTARGYTGGVDTTESENTSAYLTMRMLNAWKRISGTLSKTPEAAKPSTAETVGGFLGDNAREAATRLTQSNDVASARTNLRNDYKDFVSAALTMATGAAFKDEEMEDTVERFMPQWYDDKDTLAHKWQTLRDTASAAMAKAGAAQAVIDKRLNSPEFKLIEQLYTQPDLFTNPETGARLAGGTTQIESGAKPSTTEKTFTPPQEMQNEWLNALISVPRGQLTVEKYKELLDTIYPKYDFQPAFNPAEAEAFVENYNNPNNPVNFTIPGATQQMNETEQATAGFMQSPAGTAVGSFGNAMTGGLMENMLLDDGQREQFDDQKDRDFWANLAGEVGGSILPTVGAEKLLAMGIGKVAPGITARGFNPLLSDVGANAAYGGMRGATDDDSTFAGGLASGTAGSVVGRSASAGARGFMGKRSMNDLEALKGVDLTTLQRMGLGKLEEVFHDVPFVRGARGNAIDSFNLQDANNTLSRIGEQVPPGTYPGTNTAGEVAKALSNRYNKLRPYIKGQIDQPFQSAAQALATQTMAKKEMNQFWNGEVADATKRLFSGPNGSVTGETYRDAMTRLRSLEDSLVKKYESQGELWALDTATLLGKYRSQVRAMIGRQNPQIAEELRQVERAWAESVRIDDAVLRSSGNDGVYTPNQKELSIKKLDTSPRQSASAHGKSLGQNYAAAGRRIMGAKGVPDSIGFWKTAAVMFGPGAVAAGGVATDAGTLAAMAAGLQAAAWAIGVPAYTAGVKRAMQAVTSGKRPAAVDNDIVRAVIAQATRELLDNDQTEGVE